MNVTLALAALVYAATLNQVLPFERAAIEALAARNFPRCAQLGATAVRTGPKEAIRPAAVAARCYMETGDPTEAAKYIDIALSRGYRNCKSLAEIPLWEPLRMTTDWQRTLERCRANEERYYGSLNAEVFMAFLEDQRDRSGDIDREKGMQHDQKHRRIVHMAVDGQLLRTSDDYYHAGMIMQHGSTPDDYALARALAERAAALDPSNAPAVWLIAAATDRYLHSKGEPQIYGTQLKQVDGKWTLEPFNPRGATDDERLQHGIPVLAERLEEVEELNLRSATH